MSVKPITLRMAVIFVSLLMNRFCSRTDRLSLDEEPGGQPILAKGMSIMEIKTPGGMPLWMTQCLTKQHLYKTSYSKYGTAYQQMLMAAV